MKKSIIILICSFLSIATTWGQTADFDINILMQPGVLALNTNGNLNIQTGNNGNRDIVANSLRITISVGTNAEIIGLNTTTDSRWTVQSLDPGTNNTIRLTNSGGTMTSAGGADPAGEINLIVRGTQLGGPSTITGTIGYIAAGNPLLMGANNGTQGNSSTANDNSTTSLTVNSVLPVALQSFNVVNNECSVDVTWKSTSEINFKQYVIEYSTDGISFNEINKTPGKGDNADYELKHTPQAGKGFYRIKLVDQDNRFTYTKTISVNIDCNKSGISVFPNPVNDVLNVNITNNGTTMVNAILTDMNGKRIMNYTFRNGTNQVNVAAFSKGIYMLTVLKPGGSENIKIIKN